MSRTALLVGGDAPHRRAVRDVLRSEGIAALEAEGAPAALALLREAAFDVVLVADEVRRLALQGLFVQLKKADPAPLVFLLPIPGSDPAQLRSMAGGTSRLLDPEDTPEGQARAMLIHLDGAAITLDDPPPPSTDTVPPPAFPPPADTVPAFQPAPTPRRASTPAPMAPRPRREPTPAPTQPIPAAQTPSPGNWPAAMQMTDPSLLRTPPAPAWAVTPASKGLADYARGTLIEKSRALEVVVAQRRGEPPVILATPTASASADQDWSADLMRGATVAARIAHQSLPKILEIGTAQSPFIASNFAPGMTLARLTKRLGEIDHAFTYEGAAALVADVLGALEAVHDAKLIHGALMPRSIWVTEEGGVQLMHVGVAHLVHVLERNMRGPNLPPMSWEYEAPECILDGAVDSKSDLYAAGVVCWELIACERLFARSDQMTTQDAVTEAPVPPLDVPRPVELCILRLLSRDPDQRPKSAAAAKEELLQAMKDARGSGGRKGSGSMMGRLFGKRAPESVTAKRLEGTDPWTERAGLVKLAMR